jgi:hypothetical protein
LALVLRRRRGRSIGDGRATPSQLPPQSSTDGTAASAPRPGDCAPPDAAAASARRPRRRANRRRARPRSSRPGAGRKRRLPPERAPRQLRVLSLPTSGGVHAKLTTRLNGRPKPKPNPHRNAIAAVRRAAPPVEGSPTSTPTHIGRTHRCRIARRQVKITWMRWSSRARRARTKASGRHALTTASIEDESRQLHGGRA